MAKFAVLLFAIVAINAASARPDIKLFNHDSTYDVERFDMKHGNDLDQYYMQFKTINKGHTWVQLSMEIRELTRDLTKYFEDCYFNNVNVKQTLRQYLHHLELVKNEYHLETVLVDNELVVLFDQMYSKLYDIILSFTQTSKYERFVDTDLLKREFITVFETVSEDIYKYVQHFETKYQGTERYLIVEKILKNYLLTIYQLKADFYPISHYNVEKVHENYGVHNQRTLELIDEIKNVIFDLRKIFRGDISLVKQDIHVYIVEIRKMIFLVDSMVQKLKMHVFDFEGDRMVLNQIIDTLETTLRSFEHVIEYNTFNGMSQLMKELDQFLFTVVEQFHRLVMIHQDYQGRFYMDFTKVLEEFFMTIQKFKYFFSYGFEHESTYKYTGDYKYSGDYKYGKQYGYGYDYDYSYNMKPHTTYGMEHKTYGYGKFPYFY